MKAPFGTATRSDVWFTLALAVIGIVGTVWQAIDRLLEILPNRDVPVDVEMTSSTQTIAIEGVGDAVPVDIDSFTVHVSNLPPGTFIAAIGAAVVPAVTVTTVLVCLAWLLRNIGSGRIFSSRNTRLVTTAALATVVGWLLTTVLNTAAANGALALLSPPDRADFTVSMSVSFLYLFAAMVAGCVAAAFHAGERMQRDSEGLV